MPPPPRQPACWEVLRLTAREEPGEVFALLDGARVRTLPASLAEQEAEYACLHPEEGDDLKLTRSPFLVRVTECSRTAAWLAEEGWGRDWGIYALCPYGTDLDEVLRDCRENTQARLPDGRAVWFRFYDPRVWRPFFPTCDAAQLRQLFGKAVLAFACESGDGRAVFLDMVRDGQPRREVHALPDA